MEIIVHRGSHQIGGTCIEIRSGKSAMLLDVGLPLDCDDQLAKLPNGKDAAGPDLINAGILKDIPGIYLWDSRKPNIEAIIISHPHLDHYGVLRYVKPEIPVYMGAQGWKIISKAATLLVDTAPIAGVVKFFMNGRGFKVSKFNIIPYLIDHSAFDSYAFHITDNDKSIIYTGDFRTHGRKGKLLDRFLDDVQKSADLLLIEGTMMSRPNELVKTEYELEKEIAGICRRTNKLVLAYCSSQNIDRLVTIYKAAKKTGRIFVVDIYTAHIFASAAEKTRIPYPGKPGFGDIRVYYPWRLSTRIANRGHIDLLYQFRNVKIDKEEIRWRTSEIVILVRPSVKRDIEIISDLKGTVMIYSLWPGYLQKKYTADFVRWLEGQGCRLQVAHTSGHATVEILRKVIDTLKPRMVVPVHTALPGGFGLISPNVVFLQDGIPFTL